MNVSFSSSIWWGPHSLCHLPKVNQHTWTWVSTSPWPRPELKPVFSHYPWILPPHLHTGLWQGEAERHGPTAQQWATRSASLSWCCWANRQWESPVWCCALSKASSMNTRRAPLEVRQPESTSFLLHVDDFDLEENMSLLVLSSYKRVLLDVFCHCCRFLGE